MQMEIGVLAFQGSVAEHLAAARAAAYELGMPCKVREVRTSESLGGLSGLIIPGGESTTLYKLCQREDMVGRMREIPALFGTCAGAIMLAKSVSGAEYGQETLSLMDICADRNAYGAQSESFEEVLRTGIGRINAVFIRAPRITSIGNGVSVLARRGGEAVACEQKAAGRYFLATCFHPELAGSLFHRHFLRSITAP